MAKCKDCRYAQKSEQGEGYECHRYPPQTHLVPTQHPMTQQQGLALQSVFPVMAEGGWCGEYAPAIADA